MAGQEKYCDWYFDIQTGEDEGPSDALGQNFKGNPYSALVRESIQNSLDVPISRDIPVKVVFSFGSIDSLKFPNFFKIKEHIKGCMEFWHQKPDLVSMYQRKLNCFEDSYNEKMPYLRVSDYNTSGMPYKGNGNNEPFYAFVRASKISIKTGEYQGGTYGFGKAAYFQLSPINTLFISTMTSTGERYFEGKSALCTHLFNGEKKTSVGFYDDHEGKQPVSIPENIPKLFRREEPGTDFFIWGFNPDRIDTAVSEMLEEVLRSFFPAILYNRLIVEIRTPVGEAIVVNKENLGAHMEQVFPDEQDKSSQFRALNPRPYYDALLHAGEGSKFKLLTGKKSKLGEMKMFVKLSNNATDKILFARRPLMIVYAQKTSSSIGFSGLVLCDDNKGDTILSKLENSSHSKWSPDFYRDSVTMDRIEEGVIAMDELNEFKAECITTLAGDNKSNTLSIAGLEDLLYIPDSLIDDEEDSKDKILGSTNGIEADQFGAITTKADSMKINEAPENEKSNIGTIIVDEQGRAKPSKDGKDKAGADHGNGKAGGKDNIVPGAKINDVTIEDITGTYFRPMNVPMRTFAQIEDGVVYHYIIIHSDRIVSNGKLELTVCGEQYDIDMSIIETDNGMVKNNTIEKMAFGAETVRIRVRFADNIKHTIKTKLLYEE